MMLHFAQPLQKIGSYLCTFPPDSLWDSPAVVAWPCVTCLLVSFYQVLSAHILIIARRQLFSSNRILCHHFNSLFPPLVGEFGLEL